MGWRRPCAAWIGEYGGGGGGSTVDRALLAGNGLGARVEAWGSNLLGSMLSGKGLGLLGEVELGRSGLGDAWLRSSAMAVAVARARASRARGVRQWCQGGAVPGKQGAHVWFWADARPSGRDRWPRWCTAPP